MSGEDGGRAPDLDIRALTDDEQVAAAAAAAATGGGFVCGGRVGGGTWPQPGERRPRVVVYTHFCPYCDPDGLIAPGGTLGRAGDGGRCYACAGRGMMHADDLGDLSAYEPGELRELPRPPAVMRSPCVDCAYRPGSPEDPDNDPGVVRPDASAPFYCHHGMVRIDDGYEATAYVGTLPLGGMVCAGWWALATGRPLPDRAFRDPGGADRPESAPPVVP
jgi:hypothetical protein